MTRRPLFIPPQVTPFNDAEFLDAEKKFQQIYKRVVAGKQLQESEKNFFAQYIPTFLPAKKLSDFAETEDFEFKMTYLSYWYDLTEGVKHYKPISITEKDLSAFQLEDVKRDPAKYKVEIGAHEVQSDLTYLESEADRWYTKIRGSSNGDNLWCVKQETEEQLKQLRELPEFKNDPYMRGTFHYRLKKQGIILQSKYAYLIVKEEMEQLSPADLFFQLNGTYIELTECAILHILFRHYAALTKRYQTGKSFHNTDFHFRKLPEQLRDIIKAIEDSGLYTKDSIAKISFKLNGVPYCIRTGAVVQRQIAGTLKPCVRIQTFYPVTDKDELNTLLDDYSCIKVNNELEVYCKK